MCIQSCLSVLSIGRQFEAHNTILNVMLYVNVKILVKRAQKLAMRLDFFCNFKCLVSVISV